MKCFSPDVHWRIGETLHLSRYATSSKNLFEPGNEDVFVLHDVDVGDIIKIRVSHNNRGDEPDWFLEKVRNYSMWTLSV